MKTLKISVLLLWSLLLIGTSCAFASSKSKSKNFESLDKIVSISSTYNNIVGKKNLTDKKEIKGTLIFFKFKDKSEKQERLFGLTTSHVTQGELGIKISNYEKNKIKILGRLANNDDDIEIFEFPTEYLNNSFAEIVGEWDEQRQIIVVKQHNLENWLNQKNIHGDRVKIPLSAVSDEKEDSNPYEYFTLKGEWISNQTDAGYNQITKLSSLFPFGSSIKEKQKLSFLPIENEFYSQAQIIRGMSGSPLLSTNAPLNIDFTKGISFGDILSNTNQAQDKLFILGLAKSLDSSMSGSWFVTYKSISKLLSSYIGGDRGIIGHTKWKMKSGITFRDFGNGSHENVSANYINLPKSKIPTGGPGRVDSGGPGRVDGGGPGRVDGGGPGRVDGGDDPYSASISNNIGMGMNSIDSLPGVTYMGDSILGFKLNNGLGLYVEGNPEKVINYFSEVLSPQYLRRISATVNLLELFTAKYKSFISLNRELLEDDLASLNKEKLSYRLSIEYFVYKRIASLCNESPEKCQSEANKMAMNLGKMSLQEFIDYNKSLINEKINILWPAILNKLDSITGQSRQDYLRINSEMNKSPLDTSKISLKIYSDRFEFSLVGPPPENELIKFKLDHYGRLSENNLPKSTYFNPIIAIRGDKAKSNNNLYIVDLRSFFFVNTLFYQDYFENPGLADIPDAPTLKINSYQRMLIEGPVIRYRTLDSPQIYEVQFNHAIVDLK